MSKRPRLLSDRRSIERLRWVLSLLSDIGGFIVLVGFVLTPLWRALSEPPSVVGLRFVLFLTFFLLGIIGIAGWILIIWLYQRRRLQLPAELKTYFSKNPFESSTALALPAGTQPNVPPDIRLIEQLRIQTIIRLRLAAGFLLLGIVSAALATALALPGFNGGNGRGPDPAPGPSTNPTTSVSQTQSPSESEAASTPSPKARAFGSPSQRELAAILLTENRDLEDFAGPVSILVPDPDRGSLFDLSGEDESLCRGVAVPGQAAVEDISSLFENYYGSFIGNQATSFSTTDEASALIRDLRIAASTCGFRIRSSDPSFGAETLRFVSDGPPYRDYVFYRVRTVVVEIATRLKSGRHSLIADELAEITAERAQRLRFEPE